MRRFDILDQEYYLHERIADWTEHGTSETGMTKTISARSSASSTSTSAFMRATLPPARLPAGLGLHQFHNSGSTPSTSISRSLDCTQRIRWPRTTRLQKSTLRSQVPGRVEYCIAAYDLFPAGIKLG